MSAFKTIIVVAFVASFTAVCAMADDEKNAVPAAVKTILEKAEQIELYSLHPDDKGGPVPDGFHGWKILGKTVLKEDKSRKEVLQALYKGVAEGKDGAKCFEPRHGIRATAGGKSVDLVICFACSWVYVFEDGKRTGTVVTSGSPEAAFDKILKDAGVGPKAK